MTSPMFTAYKLGPITLNNRIVMAPMTRCRCPDNLPGPVVAAYYRQRAAAGLIITEGTSPSPNGLGYARIPGLYTEAQAKAWQSVTTAVHAAGGRIFVQLMHTGRVSHPLNMPANARIMAPSAVALAGNMWTDTRQMQPYPTPSAMTESEIAATVDEYAASARLAVKAGFDGVELHGANGYLIDQFLNPVTNTRSDSWGGTPVKRLKFALEVAARTAEAIGPERVGIRLSPFGVFNGMGTFPEMEDTFVDLAGRLGALGLVYLHTVDHSAQGAPSLPPTTKPRMRAAFKGSFILSGGYDRAGAEADLTAGRGDLVAFGRPFISNPDLVAKLRENAPLTPADPGTFYTPGEKGYTDY